MQYDFDRIISRKNTDSIKYDFAAKRGKPEDVLPLWVADMDFSAPPCVSDALRDRVNHGIFGYSDTGEQYDKVLEHWFSSRFSWKIQPQWVVKTPGVVNAVNTAIRALTQEGDAVLIQPPVYYPFANAVGNNSRKLVENQLVYQNGAYSIDFTDLEEKILQNQVKLFILCSPHNPVGRVWTPKELRRMGDICLKHGVIVISDEIHADFVYPGYKHTVFSSIDPEFAQITITCTAPSKTFNLAGLHISNIVISNETMRRSFLKEMSRTGISQPNVMGFTACMAAYRDGGPWLEELLTYIKGNVDYVRDFLARHLPKIKLVEPEGTYLIWLDFHALGLTDKELDDLMVYQAKLWLDDGSMFGNGGSGFQRINIACPRATLELAMKQLSDAVKRYL